MEVIQVDLENIQLLQLNPRSSVMALGYFDGVHLGHQKIIKSAKKIASQNGLDLAVLSFFPHPKSILHPNHEFNYLESIDERINKMQRIGVDIYYIIEFNHSFSTIEPDEFIQQYVIGLGAKHIVCGFDYQYGVRAKGSIETLKVYEEKGVPLTVVKEQKWANEKISSTIIRNCLSQGDVHKIPYYLGSFYKTRYCCNKGVDRYYMLPKPGVYKVLIEIDSKQYYSNAQVTTDSSVQFEHVIPKQKDIITLSWLEKLE